MLVGWAQRIESNPDWAPRTRKNARPWTWNVVAGALGLLGVFLLAAVLGRTSVDDEALRFRDAWNQLDQETLAAFAPSTDGSVRRGLDRLHDLYPLTDRPQLGEILRTDEILGRPITMLHSPALVLTLRWRLAGPFSDWEIVAIQRR